MFRLRPIQRKRAVSVPSRALDAAFAIVLLFAFAAGGATALSGLPRYADILFPAGLMAAQAHGETQSAVVRLALPSFSASPSEREALPGSSDAVPDRPAIAIVVDDLGEDLARSDRAMLLPAQVALAFLPFAESSHWLAPIAAKAGHEVLVHVPMESIGGTSAGPMALTVDLTPAETERRLQWAFAQVPGFVGINNHEGSRFTADAAALMPVVKMLAARKVFFLDSRTVATSQVVPLARRLGVASAARDVFLDDTVTAEGIAQQLKMLETQAQASGVAIAIGHPHDLTLGALANWTRSIEQRGFALVPLREAIRLKTMRATQLAAR